ncbi:uncharacterized protein LOC119330674 [Triticum dicoccoides]|uniref:uncharacterized protein LOC119330674 n=1 Tax=Triticum dicoccoides TaxID=85692 RepID=UPI001891ECAE|nr:uncharacterized protein LOC119330674 [Triticum dicoccoides]
MAQSHDQVLASASLLHRPVTVLPVPLGDLAAPTTPSSALKVMMLLLGGGFPLAVVPSGGCLSSEFLVPLFSDDDAVDWLLILVWSRWFSCGGGAVHRSCFRCPPELLPHLVQLRHCRRHQGPGDVVVVVGPPVAVLTSRGAVVVVLSTGSPAGAVDVCVR